MMIIALIVFLQIGGIGVASVSFVGFALALFALVAVRGFTFPLTPTLLLCLAVMLLSTLQFVWVQDAGSMILRTVREWFVLSVMVSAAGARWRWGGDSGKLQRFIARLQFFLLAIVIMQFVALKAGLGVHAFLPWSWYGSISGTELDDVRSTTLASYWLELGMEKGLVLGEELIVRPSAFYAEPSYYGFIAFSLYAAYAHCTQRFGKRVKFCAITLLGLLISQTLSGVVILILYVIITEWRYILRRIRYLLAIAVGLVASIPFYTGYSRLFSVFDDSVEASGFIRLVKPFLNMQEMLEKFYFLGVNPSVFERVIGVPEAVGAAGLDNGVLNIFQFYGFGALIIFFLLKRKLKGKLFLYLILCGVFNGTLFGFDKAFVFVFVAFCFSIGKLSQNPRTSY
ncbi:hypothetical protein [Cupriavidus necator]